MLGHTNPRALDYSKGVHCLVITRQGVAPVVLGNCVGTRKLKHGSAHLQDPVCIENKEHDEPPLQRSVFILLVHSCACHLGYGQELQEPMHEEDGQKCLCCRLDERRQQHCWHL